MLRSLRSGLVKFGLLALLFVSLPSLIPGAHAQSILIHYWNFNNFTTTYTYPTFPAPIDADYSRIDTSKARIVYSLFPGTSATYHSTATIMDPYTTATADYDTVNLRMSAPAGNSIRPRNPMDSVYLMFYIPTTNYQNIAINYASQSSSTSSGDTYQYFDYSVDSGATWITTGLSKAYDSAWLVFHRTTVTISNAAVNNNPRLVFRIHFVGHNTGTSGNNRFDNVSVDGDTIVNPVLIHYWHFNNYTTTYTYPTYPAPIDADYSLIDTSKTKMVFSLFPGTSATYHNTATIMDPYTTATSDYDTVNLRLSQPAGNSIRPRNPMDSVYLKFYMPTTGYHDVTFSYASQSSSTGSGDTYQYFDYSTDSGMTWVTTGLSKLYDSAWLVFHRTTVTFTSDSSVNNNPKFVFRIHFVGHNTGTSGNNRFDNVTLDGTPYLLNNTITTTTSTFGPYCNASAAPISVAFTSTGTYTGTYSVQLSNSSGSFASGTSTIGTGTVSPISAILPAATAAGSYRVRVINSAPATNGTDNGSNIVVNGPPVVYNVTGGGGYCSGGSGLSIGLSGSQSGVSYQLFNGSTPVGSTVSGSGSAISFGTIAAAATYTVSATNTSTTSCINSMNGSATVSINPLPAAITGITNICANNSSTLSTTSTGGSWSSNFAFVAGIGSTSGVVSGASIGIATISYTFTTGCYTTTPVTVNPAVSLITGTGSICAGSGLSLSDGSYGGSWSSSNILQATVDPYGNVSAIAAGTPSISYIVSAGCYTSSTITVNAQPAAITGTMNVCTSGTTTLGNTLSGGTWSSSNIFQATIDASLGTVTGISAGDPSITYMLPTGCAAYATITVNALPAAITGTTSVCVGSAVTLSTTSSGGSWTSSDITKATISSSGSVNGVASGNPSITYTLPTGCMTTSPFTVNALPTATTGTDFVCSGLATTLTNTSGSGIWTSSNAHASVDGSGNVTGASAGASVITFTLSDGCFTTTPFSVNATPATITGTSVVCEGSTSTLSDGSTGGSWSSSDVTLATVSSGGLVTGVLAGSPTITYSFSGGCQTTATLTVYHTPGAISGVSPVCAGSQITVTDADAGGSWSTSNTNASIDTHGNITGETAGSTIITYMLGTGCNTTAPATINPLPATITGTPTVCAGLTTSLASATSGGTWTSSNTDATIDATSGVVSGVSSDTVTMTYTLPTGCLLSVVITVNPLPAAISGAASVCQGSAITLIDADGGGSWTRSNTNVSLSAGTVTGITAGTSVVTYTLPTGCATTANVIVNPVAAVTGASSVCTGYSTSFSDFVTGGSWTSTDPTTASIDASLGTVSGIASGVTQITYTLPSGCIAVKNITVNTTPSAITGSTPVCSGSTITLTGSGGGTWHSSNPGIASVNATTGVVSGIAAGTTTISYTLATGCFAITTATIDLMPATISGGSALCSGSSLSLSDMISGGTWNSSDASVATISGSGFVSGVAFGSATVSYTLSDGCMTTEMVSVNPLPAAITGSTTICIGGGSLLSDSFSGGIWSSNDLSVATVGASSGAVAGVALGSTTITYTLPGGCRAMTTVSVHNMPATYATSGGGTYCAGGTGFHVRLSGSVTGVNYQLYNSGSTVGSPLAGTGAALDFGIQTTPGTYSVIATDVTTACFSNMMGDAVITVNPLPHAYALTGGGSYCPSGIGIHIGLDSSVRGVDYQLFMGSTPATTPIAGTGSALDFGLIAPVGTYTAVATTTATGCENNMTGSASVSLDTLPVPVVSVTASAGTNIYAGQSDTLTAIVTNGGPSPTYQWVVNGTYIAGATHASYASNEFFNDDSVTCLVTSSGPCGGVTVARTVIIKLANVGVVEVSSFANDVKIIPNPNKGSFSVKGNITTSSNEDVTIMVTDMLGQLVHQQNATVTNGMIDEHITLSNAIANGMYLISLRSSTQTTTFHMVVEQ
jgi:trimeric autotransporter adhesin